jgi:hypothetical protein
MESGTASRGDNGGESGRGVDLGERGFGKHGGFGEGRDVPGSGVPAGDGDASPMEKRAFSLSSRVRRERPPGDDAGSTELARACPRAGLAARTPNGSLPRLAMLGSAAPVSGIAGQEPEEGVALMADTVVGLAAASLVAAPAVPSCDRVASEAWSTDPGRFGGTAKDSTAWRNCENMETVDDGWMQVGCKLSEHALLPSVWYLDSVERIASYKQRIRRQHKRCT